MNVLFECGRRFGVVLAVVLLLGIPCVPASAQDPVGWVLVGGGGERTPDQGPIRDLGLILWGPAANPKVVPGALNPHTRADGEIEEGPSEHCTHQYHYHGLLYDVPGSGAGCGWGAVVPLAGLSSEVSNLACAIGAEQSALQDAFATLPPNYADAVAAIEQSLEYLADVRTQQLPGPPYKLQIQRVIKQQIRLAIKLDRKVQRRLSRIGNGQGRRGDTRNAEKELKRALRLKRQAFARMVKARKLLESE